MDLVLTKKGLERRNLEIKEEIEYRKLCLKDKRAFDAKYHAFSALLTAALCLYFAMGGLIVFSLFFAVIFFSTLVRLDLLEKGFWSILYSAFLIIVFVVLFPVFHYEPLETASELEFEQAYTVANFINTLFTVFINTMVFSSIVFLGLLVGALSDSFTGDDGLLGKIGALENELNGNLLLTPENNPGLILLYGDMVQDKAPLKEVVNFQKQLGLLHRPPTKSEFRYLERLWNKHLTKIRHKEAAEKNNLAQEEKTRKEQEAKREREKAEQRLLKDAQEKSKQIFNLSEA